MLSIYWLCFATGGAFVLLSVLGGLDGADFGDAHFDLPLDGHLDDGLPDHDVELVDGGHRSPRSAMRLRGPWYSGFGVLKSFKFWTFSLCFFGLTGLVLSHLSFPVAPGVVAIAAVCMGVLCGTLVAGSLRALRRRKSDSLIRSDDLVGLIGTVELPFDSASRGKVRLHIKGSLIDSIAYTNDDRALKLGDRVLVIGSEQNRLWVVSADSVSEDSMNESKSE